VPTRKVETMQLAHWWNRSGTTWLFLAGALIALEAACGPARCQERAFRVDSELFKDQDKMPLLQTLTIFHSGMVYDFLLTTPQEVTVLDPLRGRITLLDEGRRVKATVTTQEILEFTLALQTHAAQEKDPLLVFCATPQFETTERSVEQQGQTLAELHLSAKPLSYVALGQQPAWPQAAALYRQFADWAARLNATRPGNLPPAARLALNEALAERGLVPLEIRRTIPATSRLGKRLELRSQHRFNWTLSGEDHKRLERVGDMLATYQVVSFQEFLKPPAADTPPQKTTRK
jgi:hypothetical protein